MGIQGQGKVLRGPLDDTDNRRLAGDDIDLRALLYTLRRQARLIMLSVALCVSLGLVFVLSVTPIFTASSLSSKALLLCLKAKNARPIAIISPTLTNPIIIVRYCLRIRSEATFRAVSMRFSSSILSLSAKRKASACSSLALRSALVTDVRVKEKM